MRRRRRIAGNLETSAELPRDFHHDMKGLGRIRDSPGQDSRWSAADIRGERREEKRYEPRTEDCSSHVHPREDGESVPSQRWAPHATRPTIRPQIRSRSRSSGGCLYRDIDSRKTLSSLLTRVIREQTGASAADSRSKPAVELPFFQHRPRVTLPRARSPSPSRMEGRRSKSRGASLTSATSQP